MEPNIGKPGEQVTIKIATVECSVCHNLFWVRGGSIEFAPKYCCYCGAKFNNMIKGTLPKQ